MAELTIRLIVDPESGKKNVVIGYDSDRAALPMEHEEDHRRLVEAVLAGTGISPDELGEVIVEREGSSVGAGDEVVSETQEQAQPLSEDQ